MTIPYQQGISLCLVFLLSACSHSLYQAKLDVLNSEGKPQQAIVYWTKMARLIGTDKAGPIVLMTGCSTRRPTFVDSPAGIVFKGMPGEDQLPGQSEVSDDMLCGKIANAGSITELTAEPLLMTISCEAVKDEMSLSVGQYTPSYIQARQAPYRFELDEQRHWSLFGAEPEAPKPPDCR